MMPRKATLLVIAVVAATAIAATSARVQAEIYRWLDSAGVPHYSEGIDSVPERHRPTAIPLSLRNAPRPPAPTGSPGADAAPDGRTVIAYAPGQAIVVEARINGTSSVRLLLDTGADRTIISPVALASAGVALTDTVGTGGIAGITGKDRLPYVLLESLEIAGLRLARVPVGAYRIAEGMGDGLLGRDFLDRFHVTIDTAKGLVTLAPKR